MFRFPKRLCSFVALLALLVACTQDPPLLPDNNPPSAQDQRVVVGAGKTLEIALIASDPDGDVLSYSVDKLSSTGVSVLKTSGFASSHKVSYRAPAEAKKGDEDSFQFTVKDPAGATATATVTISIQVEPPPLDAAEAQDDSFSTMVNTPLVLGALSLSGPAVRLSGSLLDNDKHITASTRVVIQDTTTTQGGQLSLNAQGAFIYTPKTGFTGDDWFSYQIKDDGQSPAKAEATVTVRVEEANAELDGMQRIIYLKADAASGGDGSASKPYRSLLEAEIHSKPGDVIVLQAGRYAPAGVHSILLKNDQKILGQEADVVVNGIKLLDKDPDTATVLSHSQEMNFSLVLLDTSDKKNITVVRQSDNVTIKGLTIDRSDGTGKTADTSFTTGGAAIVGADVLKGTISIEDVRILYPGGFGITFAESSGCPSANCDDNVEDPTDSTTLGTSYHLIIRNVLIESPRNTAIAANDNSSVIIDNVRVNNAVKLDPGELGSAGTEGRAIAIESEYDTSVSVTNTTVTSADPGVKAFYFFSNNNFGRNPDDAVMDVTVSNNNAQFVLATGNDLNNDGNVDDTAAYVIRVLDNEPGLSIGSSVVSIKGSSLFSHADSPYAFEGMTGFAIATDSSVSF